MLVESRLVEDEQASDALLSGETARELGEQVQDAVVVVDDANEVAAFLEFTTPCNAAQARAQPLGHFLQHGRVWKLRRETCRGDHGTGLHDEISIPLWIRDNA